MTAPLDPRAQVIAAHRLSATIKPLLAGHPPDVQGAALADLLSLFIAGHHPTIRAEILAAHMAAVEALVPASEKEIFGPLGWNAQ